MYVVTASGVELQSGSLCGSWHLRDTRIRNGMVRIRKHMFLSHQNNQLDSNRIICKYNYI